MKKIINDPFDLVDEMLDGILLAHPTRLRAVTEDRRAVVRADAPIVNKVGIVTGGGSGHLPVFLGYVGEGLADGVAVGAVFSAPATEHMLAATRAVSAGKGVLHVYGNYAGDVMNFTQAAAQAAALGLSVETVLVSDDVASAPPEEWRRRRGVAGLFFAYKIAGACAAEGADLPAVKEAAERAVANTRTMGVALSPCTIPAAGQPTFTIGDDEMEIGMGIHGEPGVRRGPLEPADAIAHALTTGVLEDLPLTAEDEVAVLVNGLGATPPEELYVLYRRVHLELKERGVTVYRAYVGEYATSMEMAGCSVTLLRLDPDLKRWLDAPADTPFFAQR